MVKEAMRLIHLALSTALTLITGSAIGWEGPDSIISPTPNSGSDEMRAAGDHFERGVDFFRKGLYDAAAVEFEAAYALSKAADLLHNLSMTAEAKGDVAGALAFEARFLTAPRAVPLSEREIDETNGRIFRLRERLKQGVEKKPSALTAKNVRADRHRPPSAAIGLIVGGSVVLVVGIGCNAGAYTSSRALENGDPLTLADYNAIYARGQALDRAGIALDVLGALALTGGAVWALADRVRWAPQSPSSMPPASTP